MQNASFFSSNSYKVLEGLVEPSLELTLVHVGTEQCKPFHVVSDPRSESILSSPARGSTPPTAAPGPSRPARCS